MTTPNDEVCRYPGKGRYKTREAARYATWVIRVSVGPKQYTTLYPYQCPTGTHWHLSNSRQGRRVCSRCHSEQPAWFDKQSQQWVIYAHADCSTAAVRT